MFKLALSFKEPSQPQNLQRGFPAPGSGPQLTGQPSQPPDFPINATPARPTKGIRSWFMPSAPASEQRGFPDPGNMGQQRPAGSMPNDPPVYGRNIEVYTPYYSRGAAAYVQNYGKVLTNPIGGGIVAQHRSYSSYGPAAEYHNGAIWWTNQTIPTSIGMQGLANPEVLAALLGMVNVQAVVRVA